jgi:hypothetical protein
VVFVVEQDQRGGDDVADAPGAAAPAAQRLEQDRVHGEVPFLAKRSFSVHPSSEPRGHLSMHVALQ